MDFWYYDEETNDWKVNVDKFIDSLMPLEDMTAINLMIRISTLSRGDIDKALQREDIKNKLSIGLLEEFKRDFYAGFRKMTEYFSIEQILYLCDVKTLKSFFVGENKPHEYKLFATLMDKDINKTISFALKDDELFHELFMLNDNFYSLFSNLDYDLFKEVIFKMENNISSYPDSFIMGLNLDSQRKILQEPISDEAIIYMLPRLKRDACSDFFCNNPRSRYLYNKTSIKYFAGNGVMFNDEILKKQDFFDKLKSDNFAEFRYVINILERNNNLDIIERRLNEYYNELISYYDVNTGMFKQYNELFTNPNFRLDHSDDPFVMNSSVLHTARYGSLDYSNKTKGLIDYFKRVTSLKLSDVVVDALFQDNIHNVWLNINEMLRYNSKLPDNMKVLDKQREKFYKTILDIDNLPSEEKIKMFKELYDKKINYVFYDDIRKLKDLSYDMIKKDLFSVSDIKSKENVNSELSEKYGIQIYDLRDKKFNMLIRAQYEYREKSNNRRNCYSIIGDDNSDIYGHGESGLFCYGYNSFGNDRVIHVLEQDSFSGDTEDELPSRYVNRIMTSDEIIRNSSWYSEIDIVNVKSEDGKYSALKPDYVVYFENGQLSIKECIDEAKRLGVPIVMIRLKRLEQERKLDIDFDKEKDHYVDVYDWRLKEERMGRR